MTSIDPVVRLTTTETALLIYARTGRGSDADSLAGTTGLPVEQISRLIARLRVLGYWPPDFPEPLPPFETGVDLTDGDPIWNVDVVQRAADVRSGWDAETWRLRLVVGDQPWFPPAHDRYRSRGYLKEGGLGHLYTTGMESDYTHSSD